MRWLLLVTLVACHSPGAPARPVMTSTPYLSLFKQGTTFTGHGSALHATRAGDAWSPSPPAPTEIQCRVDDVKSVGDAQVSSVRCQPPQAGLLIAGTWVSTSAGLYHPVLPVDEPDELALLGEDELLLNVHPEEREHSHAIDGTQTATEVSTYRGSWCVRDATSSGLDHRSWLLCFGPAGVTGGSDLVWTATTLDRVTWGTVPSDPDDPLAPSAD